MGAVKCTRTDTGEEISWPEAKALLTAKGRTERLEGALHMILARARFEQEHPTGLHMTCLSLIERDAKEALD